MEDRVVILDGGMGTMLQACGMKPGEHPEVFTYDNKEILKDIYKKYILAGSDIIYSNTFGANRKKLEGTKIDTDMAIKNSIGLAKEAIDELRDIIGDKNIRVALDVGPLGELLEPIGTLSFEEAYDIFKELVISGQEAGADIIALETFTDLYEVRAAVLAAKEWTDLPIWVSMTYESSGRTFTGTTIASMALVLEGLGVSALGFNCSLGPNEIFPLTEELKKWTNLPIIIKPNAGLPDPKTNKYDIDADEFARQMGKYKALNVAYIGACCGSTPEYIRKLALEFKDVKYIKDTNKKKNGLCSATKVIPYGGVKVVGERLNPTGKKRFANALIERDMDYICSMALEQEESGADILDINVGVPGVDEVSLMVDVVKMVQAIVNIPLQIDSSNVKAIEAGLRVYNGKAIINSVNAEDERLDLILPLAKKYGASIVGLALNEKGIPESVDERLDNAKYILKKALEYGIKKEDIIIDCLTLTVSAKQEQAGYTLEAVKRVSQELGLWNTLGVSNISFGLPQRQHITENFLIQAMQNGLNFPIINPNIKGIMDAVISYKVINLEDKDCAKYIERFSDVQILEKNDIKINDDESIESAILKGLKEKTRALTKKYLETMSEIDIINKLLIPALDVVGDKYEKQILFLPQLINAANAAGEAFDLIKEKIIKNGGKSISKGKIAVATVKGDIHDIGKNIVKVILENYGYKIFDLGRDVPIQRVVDIVQKEDLKLIGLSALMTTTLSSMKDTIDAVKSVKPDCKIWVGGAVLTKAYAMEIGADYYAKDARESVDIAKKVLG